MSNLQSGHTLRVVLDNEYVRLRLVCHELDSARCHLVCSRCDGYNSECSRHDVKVFQRDDDDLDREHDLVPSETCNAVIWMENSDIECLCGVSVEVPLYDGMPVVVEWDGDNWNWIPVSMRVERNPS